MAVALSADATELDSRLTSALAELGLTGEPAQRRGLLGYVSLLQRWNAVHNLSAAHDATAMLQQHVIDCLAIVPSLARHSGDRPLKLLDAGTGAGLPAVVLATMRPDWSVTAVDSVGKKIAFLRQLSGELGLPNLQPRHARLENLQSSEGRFEIVTSRAFSSLRKLVETTRHLINPQGSWAAMKGRPSEAELRGLPADCQLFHVEPLAVPGMDAHRCLVWIGPMDRPTH